MADLPLQGWKLNLNRHFRQRRANARLAEEIDATTGQVSLCFKVLELPANFNADLGAVLAVQAATSIRPIYERSGEGGEALANVIEPVVAKLRPLAENPPASFADEDKARLWEAFAKGEQRLGEERGQNTQLKTAIRYYGKVLEVSTASACRSLGP